MAAPRFTGWELTDVFDRREGKTPGTVEGPRIFRPFGRGRSPVDRSNDRILEGNGLPGVHDEAQQVDPDARPVSSRRS